MSDQTCNGYTNWDTWILVLYSDNTEWIYDQKIAQFDSMIEDEEDTFSTKRRRFSVRTTVFLWHAQMNQNSTVAKLTGLILRKPGP